MKGTTDCISGTGNGIDTTAFIDSETKGG